MYHRIFSSIGFPLCSLFFVIFIVLMYLNKKRYKNIENTIFISLLTLSFCCIFSEFIYVYFLSSETASEIAKIVSCKMFLIFMITWIMAFCLYLLALLTKDQDLEIKKTKRRKIFPVALLLEIISIVLVCFLSIDTTSSSNNVYNFVGDATYVAYVLGGFDILLALYTIAFRPDLVKKGQRIIMGLAIIFVAVTLLLQFIFPALDYNIQNFQFTLLLLALYLTLENQDNKLLTEHEEQKAQAEEANKEQTEFLTSMSHEIRTPMNTIIGFSDALIREGATNEEVVRRDVKNIHSAAITLLDLINNILDLSRIESEHEKIIEKEFNVQDVAIELDTSVKNKIENKDIEYSITIDPNLPQTMKGDYVKVNKIVCNLVGNIINYTNDGSIAIRIGFVKTDGSDCSLYFEVSSNGSEIPQDEYEKYYLNEEENNKINTYALELHVARLYAKMLDTKVETIKAERFNIGYKVEIPLQIINPTPIGDISGLLAKDEEIKDITFDNKKALIVDDNTINIKLIERFLTELKFNVESVTSGNECIEKIKTNDYDIIFLDHMMPIKDGIQTLNEMRDLKANMPPVIALTANSYAGVKEFYVNNGFKDYIAKPVNRGDLINIISKYL